jgi:hypothetical protein
LCLFIVIYANENHPFIAQQPFRKAEAFVHKREPFAVAVAVFAVNEAVVVFKILVSGIVWRVDIDHVDPPFVGKGEGGKGVEVVAFDEDMVRSPTPALPKSPTPALP